MKASMCPSGDSAGEVAPSGKWVICTHELREASPARRLGGENKEEDGGSREKHNERADHRGQLPVLLLAVGAGGKLPSCCGNGLLAASRHFSLVSAISTGAINR